MQNYEIKELTAEELNTVSGGVDVSLSASHTENSNGTSSNTVSVTAKWTF